MFVSRDYEVSISLFCAFKDSVVRSIRLIHSPRGSGISGGGGGSGGGGFSGGGFGGGGGGSW